MQPQLELPIGCFKMGPNGMEIIASRVDAIKEQQPKDEKYATCFTLIIFARSFFFCPQLAPNKGQMRHPTKMMMTTMSRVPPILQHRKR